MRLDGSCQAASRSLLLHVLLLPAKGVRFSPISEGTSRKPDAVRLLPHRVLPNATIYTIRTVNVVYSNVHRWSEQKNLEWLQKLGIQVESVSSFQQNGKWGSYFTKWNLLPTYWYSNKHL
jgi:hypothetical protein